MDNEKKGYKNEEVNVFKVSDWWDSLLSIGGFSDEVALVLRPVVAGSSCIGAAMIVHIWEEGGTGTGCLWRE